MQALRKFSDPVQPAQATSAKAPFVVEWDGSNGPRPTGDAATQSPARLLREHLAARLEELAQGDVAVMAEPDILKLSVQARIVVIVGLSLTLWLATYLAVAAVL